MSGAISPFDLAPQLGRETEPSSLASDREAGVTGYDGCMRQRPNDNAPIGQVAERDGVPGLQRTAGAARLRFFSDGGATRLAELYQEGALRLRLPRAPDTAVPEAVAINTAGGLTGGDRLDLAVVLDAGASAVVTTQACEKIYRSNGGEARVATSIELGAESRLESLPQPMILFDRSRTRRTFAVDMAADASLLAVEGAILGRTAMAEEMLFGMVHDGIRVRRAGVLAYADAFRIGPVVRDRLDTAATLRGARAFATLIYCAPTAEGRLDHARDIICDCEGEVSASAWNGLLLARFIATDGQMLTADLIRFLTAFRGRAMPRQWMC